MNHRTEPAGSTSDAREGKSLRILGTALAAIGALCLCLGMPMNGFGGLALASVLVFHFALRPSKQEAVLIAVPAFLFWATYVTFFKVDWLHNPPGVVFVVGTLGAGSLAVLSARAVWASGEERQRVFSMLFPAAGLMVFLIGKQAMINVGSFQGGTYDLNLFVADGSFGFHPAMTVWKFVTEHPYYFATLGNVYGLLSVAMALVYAAHVKRHDSKYFMLQLFLAAGFLGWLSYNIVPATGPVYVFGGGHGGVLPPFSQLRLVHLDKVALPKTVFRNAMPSLHMTWAILMWWNARKLGWKLHAFAFVFAILTAFATMGIGEHYMVDLVVAFPFALFIQGIGTKKMVNHSHARTAAIAVGGLLALAWMIMLRENPKILLASIAVPWASLILTLALVAYVFLRLESATSGVYWPVKKDGTDVQVQEQDERAECPAVV